MKITTPADLGVQTIGSVVRLGNDRNFVYFIFSSNQKSDENILLGGIPFGAWQYFI